MVEAGFSVKIAPLAASSPLLPYTKVRDTLRSRGRFKKFLKFFRPMQSLPKVSRRGVSCLAWGGAKPRSRSAQKKSRECCFSSSTACEPNLMTSLLPAFPIRVTSPTFCNGTTVRRISSCIYPSSCWYSAAVSFPHGPDGVGAISLEGGGDDFGVFISAASGDDLASVALYLAFDEKAGRDAKSMVRTLEAMPKWTRAEEMERNLGIEL